VAPPPQRDPAAVAEGRQACQHAAGESAPATPGRIAEPWPVRV